MMRSISMALVLSVCTGGGAFAQEPTHTGEHPQTAQQDTAMAGMPGMKKHGAGRDTAMAGMPGMRKRGSAGKAGGKRRMPGMKKAGAMPRDMGVGSMGGMHHGAGMAMSMAGPLGIPEARDGSGTAWQPDVTPMYALHRSAGRWSLMFHGNAFLQYIDEGSDRGGRQLGSVNWFMGMAQRPLAGGDLALHGMLSLEPITVGKCGYPDALATGEFCNGQPLHDRQHPHDMFMEVAALYRRALGRNLAFELYGGPAGEPALGPVAFPHFPVTLVTT